MSSRPVAPVALAACLCTAAWAGAEVKPAEAPALNPPQVSRTGMQAAPAPAPQPGPPVPWSIGQPSDDEQLYLEFINRARLNPSAEGARLATTTDPDVVSAYQFFKVDLSLLRAQFNAIPAAPPLAMNAQLWAAARLHTGDMFTNQFQGHYSSGTQADLTARLTAQGYAFQNAAENVYSYARSAWHGHAGFNADWGYGSVTGMQDPPAHRINIHSPAYREIGVGVINGSNGSVGPQLVTQDFGTRFGATPLITGVAYFDLNGNNFYDLGEGLGGITVQVAGSGYYAVTAASGGYAVPVATNGTYNVSFSANAVNATRLATITGQNSKLDVVPVYNPPVLAGPAVPALNGSNYYTFTPVAAATSYEWQQSRLTPLAVEGAENGTNRVIATVSPGYPLLTSDIKYEGNFSFHLAHVPPSSTSQYLELLPDIRVGAGSQLSFAKRLGMASPDQVALAQVSTNSGATWDTVWSQAGTGTSAETSFTIVNVGLTQYTGKVIRLRFVYQFTYGNYNPGATTGYGLYLDNIHIVNADEINGTVVRTAGAGSGLVFSPTSAGDYLLRVRAINLERRFPWGPDMQVATMPPAPVIRVTGSQVQIDATVPSYSPGTQLQLYRSTSATGPFAPVSATFQALGNNQFRVTTTGVGNSQFYRIQVSQ